MDAKPMSHDYNEKVACWTFECIKQSLEPIRNALLQMNEDDSFRFQLINEPFVVAEFGVATGYSSIQTLCTIIKTVREFNPELPITIYLNDLLQNHHEIALSTISEGLKEKLEGSIMSKVFLYIAAKDFTT